MNYIIDIQDIADELEFDLEDVLMILESFMDNSILNLTTMRESIQLKDYENIRLSAHAIKGSALNIRLNDIGQLAGFIEKEALNTKDINYLEHFEKLEKMIYGIRNG